MICRLTWRIDLIASAVCLQSDRGKRADYFKSASSAGVVGRAVIEILGLHESLLTREFVKKIGSWLAEVPETTSDSLIFSQM